MSANLAEGFAEDKPKGRFAEWRRQLEARYWLLFLGRKDNNHDMSSNEDESYDVPYRPRVDRYVMHRTDNGNGANKIVWWAAAALVTLYLSLMTGAQVWMLNMLLDLQTQQSAGNAIDAGQNAVIAMMQEALRNLQRQ